jgi:hypothetical protein
VYEQWKTQDPSEHEKWEIEAARVIAIIFLALGGLWLCLMCCLRKRINLAIALTKVIWSDCVFLSYSYILSTCPT